METTSTDIAGVVVAVGKECYLTTSLKQMSRVCASRNLVCKLVDPHFTDVYAECACATLLNVSRFSSTSNHIIAVRALACTGRHSRARGLLNISLCSCAKRRERAASKHYLVGLPECLRRGLDDRVSMKFLCNVGTRQKPKIDTLIYVFLLCLLLLRFLDLPLA